MTEAESKLIALAVWTLRKFRDEEICDIDGGDFEAECKRLGVLTTVPVAESCGEDCRCAEYWGEFPADCLRYHPEVKALLQTHR